MWVWVVPNFAYTCARACVWEHTCVCLCAFMHVLACVSRRHSAPHGSCLPVPPTTTWSSSCWRSSTTSYSTSLTVRVGLLAIWTQTQNHTVPVWRWEWACSPFEHRPKIIQYQFDGEGGLARHLNTDPKSYSTSLTVRVGLLAIWTRTQNHTVPVWRWEWACSPFEHGPKIIQYQFDSESGLARHLNTDWKSQIVGLARQLNTDRKSKLPYFFCFKLILPLRILHRIGITWDDTREPVGMPRVLKDVGRVLLALSFGFSSQNLLALSFGFSSQNLLALSFGFSSQMIKTHTRTHTRAHMHTHTHTHTHTPNTCITSDGLVEREARKRQLSMQKRRGGFSVLT